MCCKNNDLKNIKTKGSWSQKKRKKKKQKEQLVLYISFEMSFYMF